MSDLDTLATFNLPIHMLELLPIELWAIIYRWKHRFEIKDCLKEAFHYRRLLHTEAESVVLYDHEIHPYDRWAGHFTGDNWKIIQRIGYRGKRRTSNAVFLAVNPRCGIELIPGSEYWSVVKGSKDTIRNQVIENLGLKCPKSRTKAEMLALLRTV